MAITNVAGWIIGGFSGSTIEFVRILAVILACILAVSAYAVEKADSVYVDKSEKRLFLKRGDEVIKSYKAVFGGKPVGHKQKEGDERTPEGRYVLDYKKEDSAFYKAIHISYSNKADIERAKKAGVDPGELIMIHGQKNGLEWLSFLSRFFNWTDGCIAVSNEDMDEIWEAIDVPMPIEIVP